MPSAPGRGTWCFAWAFGASSPFCGWANLSGAETATKRVAIRARDLRYAYAGGRTALEGVSFEVAAGECVGLVGPNGAGKTTLFLCLCGILPGHPGVAELAGLDPAGPADRRRLPSRVGVVLPHSDDQIFNRT